MEKNCNLEFHNIITNKFKVVFVIILLATIVLLGSCSPSARVKCGCPPRRSVVG